MSQTTAGRVEDLFITDRESAPMQSVASVMALAGQGLEGDRYGSKRGTFSDSENKPVEPEQQITLIEAEAIEGAQH